MNSLKRTLRRILEMVTFLHMPIRRKFCLFSLGVSFWFVVIAGTGMARSDSHGDLIVLVGCLILAHILLVLFTVSITHSLTGPVSAMIEQIRALTKGDVESFGQIVVRSGDEIGELSMRFNLLLDTLRASATYRTIIEEEESVQDVYERLSESLSTLGVDDHRVRVVVGKGNEFSTVVATRAERETCCAAVLGNAELCRAKKTGRSVLSASYPHICRQFMLEGQEHACLPLIIGGATRGVVQLVLPGGESARSAESVAAVEKAQRYIKETVPVLQAKLLTEALRESVVRDSLTGTHNRRFLDEMGERLVALAHRRGSTMGFLMCDLDEFKSINDEHSHAVGDDVLRGTAALLEETLRTSDVLIRYGGDEFLVLLHDVDDESPETVAERVRSALAHHTFHAGGHALHATMSIGVAQLSTDADTLTGCIQLADTALYEAKARGRNQVVRYGKDTEKAPRAAAEQMPAETAADAAVGTC